MLTGASSSTAAAGNATGNKGNAGTGATANAGASANAQAAQTALTVDPSNVFTFTQTGQETPTAGQEASLTSTNNFINFCLLFPDKQKTNGQQIKEGSCNQTPMGVIAAQSKMPSAKFQNPANGGTLAANTDFTIQLAINNLETGHFTNPTTTFHMAPQVVNDAGIIKGHSHVVIEQLTSLDQKTPTDPTKFVFFKGLNDVAKNGVLTTTVDGGLPAGTYRIATINSSANHQPALVAVAQRGALDDMAYVSPRAWCMYTPVHPADRFSRAYSSPSPRTARPLRATTLRRALLLLLLQARQVPALARRRRRATRTPPRQLLLQRLPGTARRARRTAAGSKRLAPSSSRPPLNVS